MADSQTQAQNGAADGGRLSRAYWRRFHRPADGTLEVMHEMRRLETDIADLKGQIANYQKRMKRLPNGSRNSFP